MGTVGWKLKNIIFSIKVIDFEQKQLKQIKLRSSNLKSMFTRGSATTSPLIRSESNQTYH